MHIDPVIYHAAPAMAILIAAESLLMIKEHDFDIKDVLSSVGIMLGRTPIAAITNGFILYLYTLLYAHRLFNMPHLYFFVWVICFFADDFSFYWFHRASHSIRFLWASHQVHHSSQKFTFAVGIRVPWTADFTGNFLFWCWIPLIGIKPEMVLYMKSISVLYQFWLHTETITKLPNWFEAFFNTPSHHRVHHGCDIEYLDKNNGGTLIIWDKLFGTFQEELFKPQYGLSDHFKSFNPVTIAFHGWRRIFADVRKTHRIKDKVCYFIKPPGWSHDGSTKTAKQLQTELKQIKFKDLCNGEKNNFSTTKISYESFYK
ncbi:sterol desaturase family protein [Hanamia caeni]|jgi:sterol desaturase/sphingolipid hydroxylase (fatty acid hydroxylase superfamily)|uniref:Sterol desaturase family protein n=1 Tax=Hanamia caeni TaxID=2294116 RepID=A0A3M9NFL3_9BACT|nr:sterol desaturase family protein [Hanamia caeni]RNI35768.1 sterol desaturase family protein [Hanamia caeni]